MSDTEVTGAPEEAIAETAQDAAPAPMSREENLRYAYNAAAQIENYIKSETRKNWIKHAAYLAASLGSVFVAGGYIPLALLNAAAILSAIDTRESALKLADAFDQVAPHLQEDARYHLKDISRHLNKVTGLSLRNVKETIMDEQNRPLALLTAGIAVFMPLFTPMALGQLFTASDQRRNAQVLVAAKRAQQEMERLFPTIIEKPAPQQITPAP